MEWSITLTFLYSKQTVNGREQLKLIMYQPSQIKQPLAFMYTNSSQHVPATHSNVRCRFPLEYMSVNQDIKQVTAKMGWMPHQPGPLAVHHPPKELYSVNMKNIRKFQLISKIFRTLQCIQKESL